MSQTEQSGKSRRLSPRRTPSGAKAPRRQPSRAAASETGAKKTPSRRPASHQKKAPAPSEVQNTALSSLLKAVVYIVCILMVSGVLSYFGITAGNDVFAFKKSDEVMEVTVDADITVEALADILADNKIVQYRDVFVLYAKLRHKDTGFIATTQTISPSMSYDELLAAFKAKKKPAETVRVTIPEGYTVDDIIHLFVDEYGIGTKEGFVDAIQNYPFDYWFVEELEQSDLREGRKYRLEGYLYPDTYYFFTTSSEVTVINKFLANFDAKFRPEFKEQAKKLGWTLDDAIILASMIQMEGKFQTDYSLISSVFHNRLATNKTQGKLESDATIQYVLDERTEDLTAEHLKLDSPYNTRLYKGLPPGPITNVTLYALNYALFPGESDYYYFVSRGNGYTLFAKTYAEHQKNIKTVQSESQDDD